LLLILLFIYKVQDCAGNIPNPHSFVVIPQQSDLNILLEIVSEIEKLLPQFADFINQFNNTVIQSDVNVVTDSEGNMSIDVPKNMSDADAKIISNRIGIIDRLIATRGSQIKDLFHRGIDIENNIRIRDPNYVSYLTDKIQEFKRLNESYKH
jgi:hypothetical protein